MTELTIIQKGRRYYYYDEYDTYSKALNVAKYWKRKTRTMYYILKVERGGFFGGENKYLLYMNKVIKPW